MLPPVPVAAAGVKCDATTYVAWKLDDGCAGVCPGAAICGRGHEGGLAFSLREMVGELRPGHREQPRFEGALRRIVLEARDALGDGEDGFLHDLFGL